ncbi:RagB/SusD family nutrient uptake outer membrane protein [Hymenobacter sp. BT18]|uniref:RagB/SusD family nutrient uptake outer membrane protein n=1 Tax=Hymenobacter sp. BT18 TaxID=2835648 RepID=UPI00143EAE03|nr:RagB/SusD family nutrient uptake outer membrane protein [Hymenobacter sp. BT18]QIX60693.1 RagB/SusD family nutrient uptake outer membrane protein [Hymenobacter sp. BT18]
MKKYTFRAATVALLLAAGLLSTSCEKQLDIQPQQSIDAGLALGTPEGIGTAVVGAYSRLYTPGLYGTNLVLIPDLLAAEGYVGWQGTFQSYRELALADIENFNTDALRTWREAYRLININNLILGGLGTITDADTRAQYEGEMRLMRGLLYFELVRLYGQPDITSPLGVPLQLKGINSLDEASAKVGRNSVQEVYTQILADMEAAEDLLPESNAEGRFDKYDAKALLARVHLQLGQYAEAGALADEVIASSGASLNPSVLDIFTSKGSAEALFEVQQNDQNNAGATNDGLATFYSGKTTGFRGRADVNVSSVFVAQYETSDMRGISGENIGESLLYVGDAVRAGRRSFKWNDPGQNIPIIRLAEMYLIRAEANIRANNEPAAREDINLIRERAGASTLGTVTLADVLRERELELAFEGFRIHDFRRTGRTLGGNPSTAPNRVLPIPDYEIQLGNALPQNPGYN